MLERFTRQARQVVESAALAARGSGTDIGCEHLLLGITQTGSGPAAQALTAAGLTPDRLRQLTPAPAGEEPLDADSLAVVGIDLDAVRRAAETAFGPGALDRPSQEQRGRRGRPATRRTGMTPDCKMAIELGLRAAQQAKDSSISPGHLLIGLIDQGDNSATRLLKDAQVRPAELRADTLRRLATAAAA